MYITDIFRVIPQMDHHDHFRMTIPSESFFLMLEWQRLREKVLEAMLNNEAMGCLALSGVGVSNDLFNHE